VAETHRPHHPDRDDIALVTVLHALSDPIRLEIVRMLGSGLERSCGDFHGVGGVTVPTLSYHLRVLREAGVTQGRASGKHRYVSLRREDLHVRFPGVLDAIMAAARDGRR